MKYEKRHFRAEGTEGAEEEISIQNPKSKIPTPHTQLPLIPSP
jgi:hypothetical protein